MVTQTVKPFIISRTFDAPRELVFKAWTEPERMAAWLSPKGFESSVENADVRPGGTYHYSMKTPDGVKMFGKNVYREILAPERLVYVNSFSNEAAGIERHPASATWPLEMLTTITFEETTERQTTVTIQWDPINAGEEELNTFDGARAGMDQGWGGSFQQLETYLAEIQ